MDSGYVARICQSDVCKKNLEYRDNPILHNGLSASYDQAHDLLGDLGGHVHALRAQILSLLQFHECLKNFVSTTGVWSFSRDTVPRTTPAPTIYQFSAPNTSHGGVYIISGVYAKPVKGRIYANVSACTRGNID